MYQCLNISSNIRLRSFHRIIKRFVVKGPPTPFHWFGGPSETIQNIILCSGQGSQYVGMFHELSREKRITPEILSLFRTANDILGYDIIQVCIEGPKAKLDKTIHCQPAVLLANLVGTALLKEKKPWIFQTVRVDRTHSYFSQIILFNAIDYYQWLFLKKVIRGPP